ncbi:hypothetical protein NVS89_18510 [Ancylobacter sp. MQZ15Z-1]|uniref:DUF3551 domain-containing protein n=1 Tax=Ancylobacter mangrovi TaxID=2972472 RepID=A0A9X2PNQ9_9HYPH|nr:hypothetical protein [Ancylobacter mangrovi]MCS0497083.1 hypothetical protein [Ancylobacter mangrovi]
MRPKLAAGVGLAMCAGLPALPACGHDAPSGWLYPPVCCSGIDCYPIDSRDFEARRNGYFIRATRETIPYSSSKVHPSGDGHYHRCSFGGEPNASTICLFIPTGS